jgi:hypothetical protein
LSYIFALICLSISTKILSFLTNIISDEFYNHCSSFSFHLNRMFDTKLMYVRCNKRNVNKTWTVVVAYL